MRRRSGRRGDPMREERPRECGRGRSVGESSAPMRLQPLQRPLGGLGAVSPRKTWPAEDGRPAATRTACQPPPGSGAIFRRKPAPRKRSRMPARRMPSGVGPSGRPSAPSAQARTSDQRHTTCDPRRPIGAGKPGAPRRGRAGPRVSCSRLPIRARVTRSASPSGMLAHGAANHAPGRPATSPRSRSDVSRAAAVIGASAAIHWGWRHDPRGGGAAVARVPGGFGGSAGCGRGPPGRPRARHLLDQIRDARARVRSIERGGRAGGPVVARA